MPTEDKPFDRDLKVTWLSIAFSASLSILFSIILFIWMKPQNASFIVLIFVLFAINLLPVGLLGHFLKKLKRDEQAVEASDSQKLQSLELEKKQVETLLQSIPAAIVITDLQGNITFTNRKSAQLLNIENISVIGLPIQKYLPIADDPTKNFENAQVSFMNQLNKKITVVINTFPLLREGKIEGSIFLLTDITAQSEFESLKLDFVAEAAHQLRTPLTILRSYLYALSDKIMYKLTEDEKVYIDRSKLGADQLTNLIENLLNVSKVEQNELTLNLKPSYIEQIVEESLATVSATARENQMKLVVSNQNTIAHPILMDSNLMVQVLVNLLMNAIENSPKGSEIDLTTQNQGDRLVVIVTDHGKGIPSDATGRLFTKFYKTEKTLTQGSKGIGLGLYNCKAIVEAHKGKIWVNSIVGRGSSFGFEIPYIQNAS